MKSADDCFPYSTFDPCEKVILFWIATSHSLVPEQSPGIDFTAQIVIFNECALTPATNRFGISATLGGGLRGTSTFVRFE